MFENIVEWSGGSGGESPSFGGRGWGRGSNPYAYQLRMTCPTLSPRTASSTSPVIFTFN